MLVLHYWGSALGSCHYKQSKAPHGESHWDPWVVENQLRMERSVPALALLPPFFSAVETALALIRMDFIETLPWPAHGLSVYPRPGSEPRGPQVNCLPHPTPGRVP